MASLGKGYTFSATEEVTAAKLHTLIDSGSISGIVAADISDGVITDAKMSSVGGNKFTNLNIIPSGAGVIPAANLTSVAQKGANSDITSLSGLTTALSTAQGGTGATAAANAASGVVVLNASSQLPAVSGALLTNLPGTTQVNDVETTGVTVDDIETTILSVAKTITSGKTVLLMASGYIAGQNDVSDYFTFKLKQGVTIVQTIIITGVSGVLGLAWSLCGVVTGVSGAITFTVTGTASSGDVDEAIAKGNLVVLEF